MVAGNGSTGQNVRAVAEMIVARSSNPNDAIRSFTVCVEAFERSPWADVAWRFSRLMAGGNPIEFVFSTKDAALRYTVEVAGPELSEHARVDAACDLLRRLGHTIPASELVREWRNLQAGCALKWGAWLGVRYGPTGESVKIYVEAPRGMRASTVPKAIRPPLPGSRLHMIGYEPALGRKELYFSRVLTDRHELETLLQLVEWSDQRQMLLAAFTDICGMPVESLLRWVTLGYSIACQGETESLAPALFVRAKAVVGGAPALRRKLLKWQVQSGSWSGPYRDLVGPIPDQDLPDHGILTLGPGTRGDLDLRVGIGAVTLAASISKALVKPIACSVPALEQ
jgi:hypothetical protein